jgi:3'-5' exoribonuclease
VKDLKKDNSVDSYFAIKHKQMPRPYKNGYFFTITASDVSGDIQVKFWGGLEAETNVIFSSLTTHDVVQIIGKVDEYQGEPQISINPPTGIIKKIELFDLKDLVPHTKYDITQMVEELKKITCEVKNQDIKRLIEDFLNDPEFMAKFTKAPAGKSYHHSFVGGLLEHILNLIRVCYTVSDRYPELDRDLLIAGCILHDIGKTIEFEIKTTIDFSDEGKLLGHLSIGYHMVANRIERIGNFPEELRKKILHLILSHHGKLENGSPVEPKFPEALAFSMIDDSDAKTNHMVKISENANTEETWIRSGRDEVYLK